MGQETPMTQYNLEPLEGLANIRTQEDLDANLSRRRLAVWVGVMDADTGEHLYRFEVADNVRAGSRLTFAHDIGKVNIQFG
jgi:hypothetical protein